MVIDGIFNFLFPLLFATSLAPANISGFKYCCFLPNFRSWVKCHLLSEVSSQFKVDNHFFFSWHSGFFFSCFCLLFLSSFWLSKQQYFLMNEQMNSSFYLPLWFCQSPGLISFLFLIASDPFLSLQSSTFSFLSDNLVSRFSPFQLILHTILSTFWKETITYLSL